MVKEKRYRVVRTVKLPVESASPDDGNTSSNGGKERKRVLFSDLNDDDGCSDVGSAVSKDLSISRAQHEGSNGEPSADLSLSESERLSVTTSADNERDKLLREAEEAARLLQEEAESRRLSLLESARTQKISRSQSYLVGLKDKYSGYLANSMKRGSILFTLKEETSSRTEKGGGTKGVADVEATEKLLDAPDSVSAEAASGARPRSPSANFAKPESIRKKSILGSLSSSLLPSSGTKPLSSILKKGGRRNAAEGSSSGSSPNDGILTTVEEEEVNRQDEEDMDFLLNGDNEVEELDDAAKSITGDLAAKDGVPGDSGPSSSASSPPPLAPLANVEAEKEMISADDDDEEDDKVSKMNGDSAGETAEDDSSDDVDSEEEVKPDDPSLAARKREKRKQQNKEAKTNPAEQEEEGEVPKEKQMTRKEAKKYNRQQRRLASVHAVPAFEENQQEKEPELTIAEKMAIQKKDDNAKLAAADRMRAEVRQLSWTDMCCSASLNLRATGTRC